MANLVRLLNESSQKMCLYIHIPFCKKRCHFCYLYSIVGASRELKSKYVGAIVKELKEYKYVIRNKRNKILAIYIGGGSPSELPLDLLEKLLVSINNIVDIKNLTNLKQFTVELSPSFVKQPDCEDKIKSLIANKVNRVSFGAQSFNNMELQVNNCSHNSKDINKSIRLADKYKLNYNIDVLFGLIGATYTTSAETIRKLLKIMPPHIQLCSPVNYVDKSMFINKILSDGNKVLTPLQQNILNYICIIIFCKVRYGYIDEAYASELSLKKNEIDVFGQLEWNGLTDVLGIGASSRSIILDKDVVIKNSGNIGVYIEKNNSSLKEIRKKYKDMMCNDFVYEINNKRFKYPRFDKNKHVKLNSSCKDAQYIENVLNGVVSEVNKKYNVADISYRKAIEIYPDMEVTYFCLADMYLKINKIKLAVNYIMKIPQTNCGKRMLALICDIIHGYQFDGKVKLIKTLREEIINCNTIGNKNSYHYLSLKIPEKRIKKYIKLYCDGIYRMKKGYAY